MDIQDNNSINSDILELISNHVMKTIDKGSLKLDGHKEKKKINAPIAKVNNGSIQYKERVNIEHSDNSCTNVTKIMEIFDENRQ